jgi:hypothetical protein
MNYTAIYIANELGIFYRNSCIASQSPQLHEGMSLLLLALTYFIHIATFANAICTCEDFYPYGVVATCYGRWSVDRTCIGFAVTIVKIQSTYRDECPQFGSLLYDANLTHVLIEPGARRICKICHADLDRGSKLNILGCPPTKAPPTTTAAVKVTTAPVKKPPQAPSGVTVATNSIAKSTSANTTHVPNMKLAANSTAKSSSSSANTTQVPSG